MRAALLPCMCLALAACPPSPWVTATDGWAAIDGAVAWTGADDLDAQDLAWGDVDGDGDLDLAVARGGAGPLPDLVLINEDGLLSGEIELEGTGESRGLAWGDCDGDGDLDLAVASENSPNRLYRNVGGALVPTDDAGTFDDVLPTTMAVAWADHDGDGDLDLAAAMKYGGAIRLFENEDCTLDEVQLWDELTIRARDLAWADADSDGDLDLAFTLDDDGDDPGGYLLINSRIGGAPEDEPLVTGPQLAPSDLVDLVWGDFDADGDPDLVITRWTGPPTLLRNDTTTGEAPLLVEVPIDVSAGNYVDVDAADQDGDGDLDLAMSTLSADGQAVLTGDTLDFALTWTNAPGPAALTLTWGDLDGDGLPELAVGDEYGYDGSDLPLLVLENEGVPLGLPAPVPGDLSGADRCAAADLDGDGDPDLAVSNSGELQVWTWEGDGLADASATWVTGREVLDLVWGDLDGDGGPDLAVTGPDGTAVYTGGPSSWQLGWQTDLVGTALALADFDRDGRLDLAVAEQDGPLVLLAAGLPDGGLDYARVWQSEGPVAASDLAWGDHDADGDPDLAVAHGPGSLWINDGPDAGLRLAWTGQTATGAAAAAWMDQDGDGTPELALADADGDLLVYSRSGDEGFGAPWSSGANDRASLLAWADWDGDGDPDLAAGARMAVDPVRLYRNTDGVLMPAGATLEDSSTACLDLLDLDRDGDVDLRAVDAPATGGPRVALGGRVGPGLLPDGPTVAWIASPVGGANLAGPLRSGGEVEVEIMVVDRESDPAAEVRLWYSVSGQQGWQEASVTGSTLALSSSPTGTPHTLTWLAEEDAVTGDDVRLRISVQRQVPVWVVPAIQHGALSSVSGAIRLSASAAQDGDGDGWIGADCDDADAGIHPGADEVCDGLDDDCDGDLGDGEIDGDGDGTLACDDCDDADPAVHPDAMERCNGVDDDCSGAPGADEVDADADGLLACEDCDDQGPIEASEVGMCHDGRDNDCDGRTDGDDPACWWGCSQAGGGGTSLAVLIALGLLVPLRRRRIAGLAALVCVLALPLTALAGAEDPLGPATDALDSGDWQEAFRLAGPHAVGEQASRALLIQGQALEALDRRAAAGSFFKAVQELTPSAEDLEAARAGIGRTGDALLPAPAQEPGRSGGPELSAVAGRLDAHLEAGRCQAARASAWEATFWRPDLAEAWKMTGAAARCLRATRDAVLAYRRYADLGGTDPGVLDLTADLASRLGTLEVSVVQVEGEPAPASLRLTLPGAEPVSGMADGGPGLVIDLPVGAPLTLEVAATGWAPASVPIAALGDGETRGLEVALTWIGTGIVHIAEHDPERCTTAILAERGAVPAPPGSRHAVTAGTLVLSIDAAEGSSEVSFELAPGQELEIDPTRHLPAALTVAEVPAGSELRVFVEGPDGTGVQQRARLPRTEGSIDPETGVRLAPPRRLESLAGGSGGLFVDHPLLGQGNTTVTLVAGEVNVATFDWRTLEGVDAVQARYRLWLGARADAELRSRRGHQQQVAGVVLAGVGLGLLGGAGATWAGLTASKRDGLNDIDVDASQTTNEALRPLFVGMAAGGGVALGLGGVQIGLGGHGKAKARRELLAIGPWDPDAAD